MKSLKYMHSFVKYIFYSILRGLVKYKPIIQYIGNKYILSEYIFDVLTVNITSTKQEFPHPIIFVLKKHAHMYMWGKLSQAIRHFNEESKFFQLK